MLIQLLLDLLLYICIWLGHWSVFISTHLSIGSRRFWTRL